MNNNTVSTNDKGNTILRNITLIHRIGNTTVRLTAILDCKIVLASTGTEHINHLLFPSSESEADVVQLILTSIVITNGSTVRNILIIPIVSNSLIIVSDAQNKEAIETTSNKIITIEEFNA